jgi:hypothetical protein
MSNPLLINMYLNIATVTAAKGQPAMRRVAPRRSPHHSTPLRGQPEVDTQDDDDDDRRWRGQCAGSADQPLAHCADSAAATYARCPEGKPCWLPDCLLIKAGMLNIWLYFHHETRA